MSGNVGGNEYMDIGALQVGQFMNWYDPKTKGAHLDKDAIDAYIDSYAKQCKARGLKDTTFSFAQPCDIANLVKGDYNPDDLSKKDSIGMMSYNVTDQGEVMQVPLGDKKTEPLMQYMVGRLKQDGIGTTLSFGGGDAAATELNFNFGAAGSPTSPANVAKSLGTWAKSIGFSGIGFDIEDASLAKVNTPQNLSTFFKGLHDFTSQNGMKTTFTVMGDTSQWGIEPWTGSDGKAAPKPTNFSEIFGQGVKFTDMFDKLNLMMYGGGKYYIDAGQKDPASGSTREYDLTRWIDQIAKQSDVSPGKAASYIDLGFNGAINYDDPSSSDGPLPIDKLPPGATSGTAAGSIYNSVVKDLRAHYNDPSLNLGEPFFWDDNADYNITKGTPSSSTTSDFFKNVGNFEGDFFKQVNNPTTTKAAATDSVSKAARQHKKGYKKI